MAVPILAKRGTEAQILAYSGVNRQGEIAYATDTKEFYINDGTAFVPLADATRSDYAIQSPNGTDYIIVVGNDGTLTAILATSTAPAITTTPTISGNLNVGQTLTVTPGTVTGSPTPTRSLQWQRSDDGLTGWADISGATSTTYQLVSADETKYIRVSQTEENILGTATAFSAATTEIQPVAIVQDFVTRVEADGGIVESESCITTDVTYLTTNP